MDIVRIPEVICDPQTDPATLAITFTLADLQQFQGGLKHYYDPMFPWLRYTEGVRFVRQRGCSWFVQAIIEGHSEGPKLRNAPIQVWTLTGRAKGGAASRVHDPYGKTLRGERLNVCEWPVDADPLILWVCDGVILLPSEMEAPDPRKLRLVGTPPPPEDTPSVVPAREEWPTPEVLSRTAAQVEMFRNQIANQEDAPPPNSEPAPPEDPPSVGPPPRGKVARMPPTKTKTAPATVSKSQFVRDRMHLTPAQTIAEGKAQKVKLTAAFVYSIRSEFKKRKAAKGAAVKSAAGKKSAARTAATEVPFAMPRPRPVAKSSNSNDVDPEFVTALRRLVARHGTQYVRGLLDQIEREIEGH